MKFDNRQFLDGVKTTTSALGELTKMFGFKGAKKGIDDLEKDVSDFNLGPMEKAADGVSKAFLAMSAVAFTVIQNITNRVVDFGIQMAKSFTLDPLIQGFQEYELKLGSIQTIMAGSGADLDTVNAKLEELNTYADKTIYSFADMTTNIGKFTNAGVDLDTAVASIQGVANVAAVSGANAGEASRAMYNFAQALSKGYVQLIDWKSIELANMGTVEFKTQLLDAAVAAGTLRKEGEMYVTSTGRQINATKEFNDSLTDQWLTTEVLTGTLSDYADDTTDIGKKAFAAAQDVKTFTQLIDTVKEAIGSGWAQTFEILIGNFDEAKALFTDINNVISSFVDKSADARNTLLSTWKAFGGRDKLLQALKDILSSIGDVMRQVGKAWRSVFPKKTASDLLQLTRRFANFAESLKPGPVALLQIRKAFRGVFSIFSIAGKIIGGVLDVFKRLFNSFSGARGGILAFAAGLGEAIFNFDKFLEEGDKLGKFFDRLGDLLVAPFSLLSALVELVGGALGGAFGFASSAVGEFGETLSPMENFINRVTGAFESLEKGLGKLGEFFAPVIDFFKNLASNILEGLSNAFSGENLSTGLDIANVGLLSIITGLLTKLATGGFDINFGGDFLDSLAEGFEGLTGVLEGMQANLKANAILKIAGAIGILAVSLVLLASIDSDRLLSAVTALGATFGILLGGLQIISMIGSITGLGRTAASLILLSIAILILSAAIKKLADLSWGELLRGMVGLGGALGILIAAVKPLQSNTAGMVKAAASLILLGIALRIMASAIGKMGSLSWGEIAKGLTGVAGALVVMIVALNKMPKGGAVRAAVSMGILAGALYLLASAIGKFADLKPSETIKGLIGISAALGIMIVAMKLMPKNILLTAAGLVVVGVALQLIAKAVGAFGGMGWEELAKGLIGLGVSLGIIAGGLYLMSGALPGAAALIVAAGAIAILVPALMALGSMSIASIVTALLALAAAFVVLGVAGYLLTPVVPSLLGLGAAVLLLGVGLVAAGLGALAFAKAFEIFVRVIGMGGEVVDEAINRILELIPNLIKAVGEGILEVIRLIANSQTEITAAIVAIIGGMLDAIIELVPKFGEAFRTIVDEGIRVVREKFPELVELGLDMLIELLRGINERMDEITDLASQIVVKFIYGIGRHMNRIVRAGTDVIISFIRGVGQNASRLVHAGFQTIIAFINSMTRAVNLYMPQLRAAGRDLAFAIADGMTGGLASKARNLANKVKEVARNALNAAKSFLGIRSPSKAFMEVGEYSAEGMAVGLEKNAYMVDKSAEEVGKSALNTVKASMARISEAASDEIDVHPVIAPILDLDAVRKEASKLNGVLTPAGLSPDVSYSRANSIAAASLAANTEAATRAEEAKRAVVEFTQNNYSPKALTAIEIYRNTRNQLSLAKEALSA